MTESDTPAAPGVIRIGPYRIVGVIGRGGMGVVYEGVDADGKRSAIKQSLAGSAPKNESTRRRFEREAQVRVDHPNVVRVLGAGEHEANPYIAFELLQGSSLSDLLREKSVTRAMVLDYALQVCRGLSAAHEAGVVHRDIKPGNIFVCSDGTVKVLDFGIALLESSDATLTTDVGAFVGTPSYLSPEQARGQRDVDQRTDIWSLGVVMYQALSGHLPFKKETKLATLLAVILENPTPLQHRTRGIAPVLAALVGRCLEKEPGRRWASARDLAEALEALPEDAIEAPNRRLSTQAPPELETMTGVAATWTGDPSERRVVAIVLAEGAHDIAGICREVEAEGGMGVPIRGGRVIGVFGGKTWEGDEMFRAAAAALACRPLCEAVAVAAGRASINDNQIAGAVVRAAERGCEARLSGVAVDRATARGLRGRVSLRGSDSLFELDASVSRDAIASPGARSTDRLIGRELEIERIRRALEDLVSEGDSQCVLVLGPSGIGKTRLAQAFDGLLNEQPGDSFWLLRAEAERLERGVAFSLFRNLIDGGWRARLLEDSGVVLDASTPIELQQKAVQSLVADAVHGDAALACASFIGELLGVEMPHDPSLETARRDPQLMIDRLRIALLDYFAGLAESRATALVLEDLHWSDHRSLELLDTLLEQLADAPLFIFATAREDWLERAPDGLRRAGVTRIDVRGLDTAGVNMLATQVAGQPLEPALVQAIVHRTSGNPLFVEQIVLELREEDRVESAGGELPLPVSVEAAVQSRIDHLSEPEKELCKHASVFGRPFVVEEMEALGVANAEAHLRALSKRAVFGARRRGGETRRHEYRFRSPLIEEVAYRMLSEEQQVQLHRSAADALTTLGVAHHEEIARHYELGGSPAAAASRYVDAADSAARRGDAESVLRTTERALMLGAPETRHFVLWLARADALRFMGRHDEQEASLAEALEAAKTADERARSLSERAAWLSRRGRGPDAVAAADKAVGEARQSGDPDLLARALARRAACLLYAGRVDEVGHVLDEAGKRAQEGSVRIDALLADLTGQLASAVGDLGKRRAAFGRAVELYREAGDVRRGANAELNLADASNRFGAYDEAATALEQAVEKCRRVGNRLGEGYAHLNLGYAYTMLGRTEDALSALSLAKAYAASARDARLTAFAALYEGKARLASHPSPAESGAVVEDMLATAERAQQLRMKAVEVLSLSVASSAKLRAGATEAAVELAERAKALRDGAGGIEEDEADVFLSLASALSAAGRSAEALAVRAEGAQHIHDIASRIRDAAWRERFLCDVRAHRELTQAQ